MPGVSIIIPAHNPGVFLREALNSVCQQSFMDWELVVIDDNSSEDLSWITREFPMVLSRSWTKMTSGCSTSWSNRWLQWSSLPMQPCATAT